MATHAGADLAPIGRLHADMSILKWGGGVIGQLGLGLLAVNLMSPHPVNSVPPTPIALPPAYQVVKTVEWSLQIDEATLGQQLNAWAAGQPILPTPPQIRRDQVMGLIVVSADWPDFARLRA